MKEIMSNFKLTMLIVLSLVFFASPYRVSAAEDQSTQFVALPEYELSPKATAFDKKMVAILKENKLVGLSVAAFQGDKIIYSAGYGYSDLATKQEVTKDTVFRVASISKMVTATALMQLYEQGNFKLDDDISTYLGYKVRNPNYPDVKITFRQLFTHTSSIADSSMYNQIADNFVQLFREIDIKDMLLPGGQYYSPDVYGKYAPGEKFNYSNLASSLEGSLVEAISGMPFDKYCNKYILGPLEMDASFVPADIKNWTKIAAIYRPDQDFTSYYPTMDNFKGNQPERDLRTSPLGSALAVSPAGNLRANVLDISKFLMTHMNKGRY